MSDDTASLFAPLSPHPVSFAAGSAVFHIGDLVRQVYLVRTGAIHLVRHHRNGAPLVLQRAGPGSILAEASVFSERYHCDAVAAAATDAVWVSRHVLRHRLATDGTFAQAWARHLGHEVQRARLQAEIMSLKTVSGRLDAWLALRGTLPPKGEWDRARRRDRGFTGSPVPRDGKAAPLIFFRTTRGCPLHPAE